MVQQVLNESLNSGQRIVLTNETSASLSVVVRTADGTIMNTDLAPGGEMIITAGTETVNVDIHDIDSPGLQIRRQ